MSTRRSFLYAAAGLTAALSVAPSRVLAAPLKSMRIFIGTYTSGASKGIYTGMLDADSGAIADVRLVAEAEQPSFLAISPDQRFLYAVNELDTFDGSPGGAVSAYAINGRTGELRFLNQQPTRGAHPCHIITDRTGRWALVANYSGGNLAALSIGLDGHLAAPTTVVQHTGSSVNASRQEAPHAHSVHLDAKNRYVVAADLGLDKLMVYQWDARSGVLKPNEPASLATAPGAGPRHFAWHPSGQYAFVINELNSTLSALSYDGGSGTFIERHTLSTLPEGFAGTNSCADIHVAPGGRFVYGSNRGHDSIAVFGFDARAGQLTALAHTSTEGATPRNFGIAPGGRLLLAANQQSDTIVSFAIDRRSGLLNRVASAEVPTPVCIQFIEG
ncbi:MAG: lactonase family protein [Rhodothermales bacterium]|nr:lactonase family protein [Rhodothermales bacterium]